MFGLQLNATVDLSDRVSGGRVVDTMMAIAMCMTAGDHVGVSSLFACCLVKSVPCSCASAGGEEPWEPHGEPQDLCGVYSQGRFQALSRPCRRRCDGWRRTCVYYLFVCAQAIPPPVTHRPTTNRVTHLPTTVIVVVAVIVVGSRFDSLMFCSHRLR